MKQQGFSLVELSIVLVILGLLIGGILTGQSLIRAAESRSVTKEYESWVTATNVFRQKYLAFPGDMNNATAFWGKDNTYCAAHTGTAATNGTCNGNGDGIITDCASGNVTCEAFQYWKQLSLAGLIEGNYTGISGVNRNDDTDAGINAPASKVGSGTWMLQNIAFSSSSSFRSKTDYGNGLIYGAQAIYWPADGIFTPAEAWSIDLKMDDGHASKGKVWGVRYRECTLANDTTGTETDYLDYDLTVTSKQCGLAFLKVF